MSVGLQSEARRVLIQASGEFERLVMERASKLALEKNRATIDAELVKLAIESLARDNSFLDQTIKSGESPGYVDRRAG